MRLIPFSKKTSIAFIVAVSVVIVTTALLAAYGYFDYSVERSRLNGELDSELEVSTDQLSIGLALPVWNIDRDQIDKVIDGMMKNRVIYGITVEAAGRIHARTRDAQWNIVPARGPIASAGLITQTRPIVFAGEQIGTVTLLATKKFLEEELRKNMLSSFLLIFCLDLILSLGVYQLLWWWVLRPLKEIEAYSGTVSAGAPGAEAIHGNHFRGELENVRVSVEKMVELLQLRYSDLQQEAKRRSESELMLSTVLNSIPQGIFWKDRSGRYLGCNEVFARTCGLSGRAEINGKTDFDLPWPQPEAEAYRSDDQDVIRQKKPKRHFVEPLQQADGTRIWIETTKIPLIDADGHVFGVLGVYEDITERKRAEEERKIMELQLIQADKMASLGVLVSGVAHEVNNPTNFIMLNAPLLQRAWEGIQPVLEEYTGQHGDFPIGGMSYSQLAPKISPLIESIQNGAKRIKRIVSDLKDYARIEPAEVNRDVDLNAVVRSAVSLLEHMLRKHTTAFSLELAPSPLMIKGNHQRLEQVVINLVQNACDALRTRDEAIIIKTHFIPERRRCAIVVTDQGGGIKPEELSKIIDPFYTTKRDKGGTGLGLSISAGIVKDHDGELVFESVPGKGTTVIVDLPQSIAR